MRRLILLAAAMLVLAGCSDDPASPPAQTSNEPAAETTTSAEPTPDPEAEAAAELAEAQALTRTLYYDYSQLWSPAEPDLNAVAQFWADRNHPAVDYSTDECLALIEEGLTQGFADYRETVVPDVTTLAPDPDWILNAGRYQGFDPSEPTFIVTVAYEASAPSAGYDENRQQQVHVSIIDGVAYFYQLCESV